MDLSLTTIGNILTRTTGYLRTVTSHSLQPYRGCTFGKSLCGVGCYVRQNGHVVRGREWGSFLEVRENAAASYLQYVEREAHWARREQGEFSIFCSSSTDPFLPQERKYGVTASLLTAMLAASPDLLILQTHSPRVVDAIPRLLQLQERCRIRVHISIESDCDRLPGLPLPAASVDSRLEACRELKQQGIPVIVTIAPLLPIESPERFLQRIAEVADNVVIDHFIGGDGSADGRRTRRTALPDAMAAVLPESVTLDYRDKIVTLACQLMPGHVGVGIDGFAGRFLPPG